MRAADIGDAAAWPVIAAVFCAMSALGLSYQLFGQKGWYSRRTLLLMKGGTTMLAALLALYGALLSGLPAHLWLAGGIALCALADITLELRFKAGMLNFALGHLCFILCFLSLRPLRLYSLLVFLPLALIILVLARGLRGRLEQPVLPFLAYALVIAAMLALALAQRPLAALGALLFVLSDGIIFYRLTQEAGRLSDHLCMLSYYLAQFLLALSTFWR
ncbi:MAG: lysoplasmalogenase family protein [Christensenellales bacterium]